MIIDPLHLKHKFDSSILFLWCWIIWVQCNGTALTCAYLSSSSLCGCKCQWPQLLLRSLPRRLLRRRRWRRGGLWRRRRLWKWRRKRRELCGELDVKGEVQLVRRCQENTECLCRVGRPVANFPGQEEHIQPLRRLWRWVWILSRLIKQALASWYDCARNRSLQNTGNCGTRGCSFHLT